MTQYETILNHLQTNGSITSLEAFVKYRITRLAAIIHNMKEDGFSFVTTLHPTSEGRRGKYAEYKLVSSCAPAQQELDL